MKKKFLISLLSVLILTSGFLSLPQARAAASDDPAYMNCLCEAACAKAGWNCSIVGCAYEAEPVDASPECLDPGKGACICIGYGCGRAPLDYTSAAATQCLANTKVTDCKTLYSTYNKYRDEYINERYARESLNAYGYKVTNLFNNNVAKLGIATVLQKLSPPGSAWKDFIIDRIQDKVFDKVFVALQSAETKADIQVNLLKMLTLTDAEMKRINTVQPIRVNKLKDLLNRMKANSCSTSNTVIDLMLPGLKKNNTFEFKDITPDNPRGVSVTYLSEQKIVKGYDDGTFKPANPINRAEFTKILMKSAYPKESFSESGCFPDAAAGTWYAGYVCAAKKKGIIGGYPDNTFKPESTINAAEMLKILLTTLKPASIPAEKPGEPWFRRYWTAATDLGILPNDVVTPGDNITRGQMSETIFGVIAEPLEDADMWNVDYSAPESEMVSLESIVVDPSVPTSFTWDFTTGTTTDDTTTPTTLVTPTPVTPTPVTPAPVTPTGSANNSIATATKLNIAATEQPINGTLTIANDLNFYNFLFGQPGVLSYSVDVTGVKQTANPSSTVNYKGTIVNASGVEQPCTVNASSSTPNSKTTDNAYNNCYFPAGSWNIKIWGNGSSDYSATPYKLMFAKMDGAADAFEPNNTMATATSFAIGTSPQTVVNPNIWGRGDVDYYAFTLGATSQLSMKLDVTNLKNAVNPANLVSYIARLLDSSGNELNCNMSAGSFRLVHEKNDCIFPAGTYYMKVMGDSDNEFSTTPYGLTLSATPSV